MSDLLPFVVLIILLLVPAAIIFTIINVQRLRRESFHRARQQQKRNEKASDPHRAE